MGDGNPVKFLITLSGNVLSSGRMENRSDDKRELRDADKPLKSPKENAQMLLERKWQNSEANGRRNNLLEQLSHQTKETVGKHLSSQNNETSRETGHNRANDQSPPPRSENNFRENHGNSAQQHTENINEPVQNLTTQLEQSTNQLLKNLENSARQTTSQLSQSFPENRQSGNSGLDNISRHTFDSLFAVAREHRDFRDFQSQPKDFWNQVRQMSEVRVVETFVRGSFEPRVVSRYGELLDRFTRQSGSSNNNTGGLERFLSSLSPGESEIFAARYQLEKSFGANKFFVGNGVVLTERGEFALQPFLSNTGRNLRLSPQTILSLLGGNPQRLSNQSAHGKGTAIFGQINGNSPAEELTFYQEIALTMSGGKLLLNTTSASLLGLSLALYQNAGVWLSLKNLAEQILMPQLLREPKAGQLASQKSLDDAATGDDSTQSAESGDAGIAALINGALTSIEKYRKSAYSSVGLWADAESDHAGFRFAAGATGAIMSATIGCITPLAGKSAGETLGFAASLVVGLNDGGLRKFGAATLVSIVTENVQTLLNASSVLSLPAKELASNTAEKFLKEAEPSSLSIDDLQQSLFNRRMNAFITS